MVKRVLIIGGYGNFGSYIAKSLASDTNIKLLIGGRSIEKARQFSAQLSAVNNPEAIALDICDNIALRLAEIKPDIVIHATEPFQNQGYALAEACILQGCHYIDFVDARHFVADIVRYDQQARDKNLLIVSGASSVPCLTAAVIDHYRQHFGSLDKVEYGISAAQQTNHGLATTSAVLSYVGKAFTTLINGKQQPVYGSSVIPLHQHELARQASRQSSGYCPVDRRDKNGIRSQHRLRHRLGSLPKGHQHS